MEGENELCCQVLGRQGRSKHPARSAVSIRPSMRCRHSSGLAKQHFEQPDDKTLDREMGSLSAANAQFCFDIFKEMSCDHMTENIFYSPLGLLSILAVVFLGARGDSASQMEKVLHLNTLKRTADSSNTKCEQDTGVHSHIRAVLSEISKSSGSQVHMASGMFAEAAHVFLPKYLDCIEQLYALKSENIDFKNNIEEARMQINSWVENKTKGEIKDLLSPSSLASSDQLVLVNAVSFKGIWKHAFQKDQTKPMTFRLDESRSKSVQMMQLQGHFKLGSFEEPRVRILEMPDADGHLSMNIILPSEDTGLGQVTKEITYEKLKHWVSSANMRDTAVDLRLPRLQLEGSHEDLTLILAALGMTDVFDDSMADLSGISAAGGLVVSKIIHKAVLEVTEGGSELVHNNQTSKVEHLVLFQVDRPFLFLIRHKETEMILFYGRVTTP
ncbi:ovalbumin-like [Choloepus didactylus]|uniref:ovalbumin-like n=1 Tax=Choloepus didactylus TaxID=27675 RepID=UPI00189CA261|nr:ovalbumin-like [Choloepus didactylus]